MVPIHLHEFERNKLAYSENNQRFCLLTEQGTHIKSYNIDISGSDNPYFKVLLANKRVQGYRSADGIYVGDFQDNGKRIPFVIILELEGKTSFDDALGQVKNTIDHFCKTNDNSQLIDDGKRHHENANNDPYPYIVNEKHIVIGLIIGSTGRTGTFRIYRKCPIICLNSRQPSQDKTPKSLLDEISKHTLNKIY